VFRRRLGSAVCAAALLAGLCAAGPARADDPRAVVQGVEDDALRRLIERQIGETEHPPQSRFEARRRANDAAERAVTVLRSEGYYAYEVSTEVEGSGDNLRPVVIVNPGPRFSIAAPQISWANETPTPDAARKAAEAMGLAAPATPGRAAEVVAAEGRILASLQAEGYADAVAQPREVVVDHADRTVRPTFRIDVHSVVRLDGLRLQGRTKTTQAWVRRLAPWKEGDEYEPEDVAELERRLLDTGVYQSVTVALAPNNERGLRPIVVSLADRPGATLELGASYATEEGAAVNGRYTIYNRLGRADTVTFGAQLGEILNRIDAQLALPHWRQPQETLRLTALAYQDDTKAYREQDVGLRVELQKRLGRNAYRTYGVAVDLSDNDEPRFVNGEFVVVERKLATLTGIAARTLDRTDNTFDPTRGWKLDVRAEPTAVTGDDSLVFLKAVAQGTAYFAFDDKARTVIAGRLRLGSILGGGIPQVQSARRFYAGGGSSVRGYGYQDVGPRFPDEEQTPVGGLSLVETSLEVRHRFTDRWGAVAFVDAGTVGNETYPDFDDLSVGVGVGARYHLSFAPIRVDVAVPLNKREGDAAFQLYVSIGQAF
jgi:translocation and assembly module TamA